MARMSMGYSTWGAGLLFKLTFYIFLAGLVLAVIAGCRRAPTAAQAVAVVSAATAQTSTSCQRCHAAIFEAWAGTDHALANRHLDARRDLAAFTAASQVADGGSRFNLVWSADRAIMTERREDGSTLPHEAEFILGAKPLWQPLVSAPGGRWQPTDLAFDPARKEWFNVFGQEGRKPGEWGHWTGRGMNWNSMCAHCHMTGFRKNYDATTDRYASKWVEHGVGCIQCHGPMPAGHNALPANAAPKPGTPPFHGDRQRMMQSCAPCHARNEMLTADFQPGDDYYDHYRVTLPVEPGVFWPDGQQRDEDFNWTSVLLSRMGHAGVTCLDCHDPHTNRTLLPAADNQLCLQCHAAPGRVQPNGTRAILIDPLAHSHHGEGSTGNSCIACHMPTTTYMQRAPRHDHGWFKPDPLLTKELGIPNACNRCHGDKSVEWAVEWTGKWYGRKLDSTQRARARAVASAQAGEPSAADRLLALLEREDIPAWRATYLLLLGAYREDPRVPALAAAALKARHPLERSAAVQLLAGAAGADEALRPMLQDAVRLVRLDAAWALSRELPVNSVPRKELDDYLGLSLDQPVGRLRRGQDLANRGQWEESRAEMAKAAEWDPHSPGILEAYGFVLASAGRPAESAEKLRRSSELQPNNAPAAFHAALAFAEANLLREAEQAFRLAVTRDPKFHRAWYNLGLLYAQQNQLPEAVAALQNAERVAPTVPDYPYALATVSLRAGDHEGARAAACRVLALDPNNAAARQLLR